MHADEKPVVLVLTLFSGEAEFARSKEALAGQDYDAWEHRIFEHLPNAEAHARLYETVMAERGTFPLFFKLDADMVMADQEVLGDLVDIFAARPELDHLVVAVSDWMTRRPMIGAHLFSRRVRWRPHGDRLYVDPDPEFPGEKVVIGRPLRDLIFHAPDPSAFQAFHFGAHRALQASQSGRRLGELRAHNSRLQWEVLDAVWMHFEDTGDRRLGLAVLAADMVFTGALPPTVNEYSDTALREAFRQVESLDADGLRRRLMERWGSLEARRTTWHRALGPMKVALIRARSARDALATVLKRHQRSAPPIEIGRLG